jgi:2',3'-cyclic-nucleotide 2'-phosphodiesterase (5'-nucleotidase family)
MTRARWLSLWLLLFAGLAPAQENLRPLTILHTNDLHARFLPDGRQRGGFAQLATVIRREREGCHGCLLLNAGDLVQGSPVSTLFRGLPVYEVANMLGFDASTIGNHEFDYGWAKVREFIRVARFPVVSANVVDDHGRLLAPNAWIIRSANGLRVAIIGVLTADLPQLSTPDLLGPYRALAVADTVRQYANEVRGRSDLIVLLAHITPEEEDQVLQQEPEIPVVISGHAHRGLDQPKRVDRRVVVRVNAYGEELGRLDLMVDTQKKSVASSTWKRLPVDAKTISPAPDVAKAVAAWEAKVSKLVDVPIGEAKREFARKDLKELMERAMAEETGADFAFMNPGGIRDFIPKGTILARHVWNVMPFDNHVVVGTFKGSQLPAMVTAGRQVDPDREYKLAVPDFVASNQKPEMGTTDLQFPIIGPLQRDLLIDWIKKKKVLE